MGARWLRNVLVARSLAQLRDAVAASATRFGFRYFVYHGRFPGTCGDVHFDNCPDGWSAFCRDALDGGYPVPLPDRDAVTPAVWSRVAVGAGLLAGTTHTVHGPHGQWSAISFARDQAGARADDEIRAALARCHLLAGYVHDSVKRIVERRVVDPISQVQPLPGARDLNERECQVLTWVAAGKTASEIASIMPISERTVSFHLSNARRKLGAANSRHAISRAISLGLIEPKPEAPRAPGGDPA
jgi:DNA-binding CsgD family transcriptional regulator